MTQTKHVEFANFTCKFGEKLSMLDLFDKVILPSFEARKYKREIRDSEYFIIDTCLIKREADDGTPYIGLSGKIVKNTKLKRDQIFREDKGIIEDHDELESAPTSMFVLILNNHRLIYVKEISGAPGIEAFKATCSKFIGLQHKWFINKLYEDHKSARKENQNLEPLSKKRLIQKFPYPNLRITPLTDKKGLKEFVAQFDKIDDLVIKLLPTNNEDINNDDFWNQLGDTREKMHSKNAVVTFSNRKDGLDSDEVFDQCKTASSMANSYIKLKGFGDHGGTLKGNNDDFNLSIDIDDLSKNVKVAGPGLIASFLHLFNTGTIQLPDMTEIISEKIQDIVNRFFK